MTEENGTTEAPTTGTTTAPESPSIGEFINEDGTFNPGWQDVLVPEDLRGLGEFRAVTDIKSAMKQLGTLSRLKGRKGIIPPSEDATQSEKDLFYEALGRPKTPEDYQIELPKELEPFYDSELLTAAKEKLHAAGLTQAQMKVVMALDAERLAKSQSGLEAKNTADLEAAEKALRTKWGDAYEERLHIANRVIAEHAGEFKDAFLEKYGNDPMVAELLSNVGRKFMEGKLVSAETAGEGKMTPSEARNKLSEIAAEMAAQPDMRSVNPGKYARLAREQDRLAAASLVGQPTE